MVSMICKKCNKRFRQSESHSSILCPECGLYLSFSKICKNKTEIRSDIEKRFDSLCDDPNDVRRKKIRNLSLLVISGIVLILFLTPLGQFLLLIIAFLLSGPPDW